MMIDPIYYPDFRFSACGLACFATSALPRYHDGKVNTDKTSSARANLRKYIKVAGRWRFVQVLKQ
jgi:hypothetical protein